LSNSIKVIKNQVISCTKCELCKTRKNAVPGKGNSKADIVFIGEAPGRSEDKYGEPFVGAAGKNLTLALEQAGISRKAVYITNIIKCRPPKNRIPTKTEKKACQKYLDAELEIIKPEIICVLGNTAYQSILGGKEIIKNRGKLLTKNGKEYFITIHPAAIIYNRELTNVFYKDMKKLAEILSNLKNRKNVN